MKTAIFFVENYIAGGSDKVMRLLIDRLALDEIYLFINRSNDNSILLAPPLPKTVSVIFYNLVTLPELGDFANSKRGSVAFPFLKLFNGLARYPLIIFSMIYFYLQFFRLKADIFLANNGGYPGGEYCRSATIAASFLPRARVFHLFHNMAVRSKIFWAPFEWIYDWLIDSRCRLFGVSNVSAGRLKQVRNIKQEIACIHNGLESRPIKKYLKDDVLKVLNVGYLGSIKNQAMLLMALALAIDTGVKNIRLYLVGREGETGYAGKLLDLAKSLSITESIRFEGFHSDPEKYYDMCDVFVLASTVESLPLVILEAMRVGMPVISTDVGGVSEQINNGVNGYLVAPGDIKAMSEKLIFFAKNGRQIEEFGSNGYDIFTRDFAIDRMVKKYEKLLGLSALAPNLIQPIEDA